MTLGYNPGLPLPLFSLLPDVPDSFYPTRGTELAAGHDLYARFAQPRGLLTIRVGDRVKIHTGVRCHLLPDHWGGIYGRSSLRERGLSVLGVGVIDADYTGELIVLACNVGTLPIEIAHGDRIAQFVVHERADRGYALRAPVGKRAPGTVGGCGSTGR